MAQESSTVEIAAEAKSFGKPEEIRRFSHGWVEMLKIAGQPVGRATFEPGWKWSSHVKPLAKTPTCQSAHLAYHLTGVLHIKMDDGTEFDCKAGDVCLVPPGHDAWVVGDERVVIVDFQGMANYAKK